MTQKERQITQARVDNLLGLCETLKQVKYDNEQSLRDFYFYCLKCRNEGNYYALDKFKEWFPRMFHDMQAILNKRTLIRRDLEIMKAVSRRVVFGSLTFSEGNLRDNEYNMRKKAQRYLDKCMTVYEIVEEHGTKNTERYHVHYLGVLRDDLTYIDFHNGWEDITYIEAVKSGKKDLKKVSKYLCDYIIKQVPTIRRNARLRELIKMYQAYEREKDIQEQNVKWLEIQYFMCNQDNDLPF